jgi:hypothetical protein
MALTQASLKGKLKTEIGAVITITDAAQLDKVCGAIAKAVVDEIQANAVVPAGSFSTPSGPVTGTSTVS